MRNETGRDQTTRHRCWDGGWSECCICGGRIHLAGCTTRPNPDSDCCAERHQRLYDAGHLVGLYDASLPMLPYGDTEKKAET